MSQMSYPRKFLIESGKSYQKSNLSGQVRSSQVISIHVMPCQVMSSHVISCHVISSHVISSHAKACQVKSVNQSILLGVHVSPGGLIPMK